MLPPDELVDERPRRWLGPRRRRRGRIPEGVHVIMIVRSARTGAPKIRHDSSRNYARDIDSRRGASSTTTRLWGCFPKRDSTPDPSCCDPVRARRRRLCPERGCRSCPIQATRVAMRIVMTLLARNEADIVDAQIAFHLAAGVDFVIATDNRIRGRHDGDPRAPRTRRPTAPHPRGRR